MPCGRNFVALARLVQQIVERAAQRGKLSTLRLAIGRVDLLVRKIDARLHVRAKVHEPIDERVYAT